MSGFIPKVKFETVFEQDTVSMYLSPLKRKAMMTLSPYMSGPDGQLDDMGMMNVAIDFLPDHISDFKGLFDAQDNEMSIAQMCEEAYFLRLISTIIVRLFEISKLSEEDMGNSPGQPSTLPEAPVEPEELLSPHTHVKSGQDVSKPVATLKKAP